MVILDEDEKFRYQLLTSKYLDEACDVIKITLFSAGSLSKAVGVPDDPEALTELDQLPRAAAQDGVSVIAIDKFKNKVAGVAFNKILQPTVPFIENLAKSYKNSKSLKILDFIDSTENVCNLFELCQADCLMEILLLGTLPEYRKQGIGKKLCQLSVQIAQELFDAVNVKQSVDGKKLDLEPVPKAVTAIFNSFISQRIGRELGFEIAAERSNAKIEVMGVVLENLVPSETPTTTVEYRILKHK